MIELGIFKVLFLFSPSFLLYMVSPHLPGWQTRRYLDQVCVAGYIG
jgi:hypothetical protein